MKKVFFILATLFMVSTTNFANNAKHIDSSCNTDPQLGVKLVLNLGDITNMTESELNTRVSDFYSIFYGDSYDKDPCRSTITLKAKVETPIGSVELSVSVTDDCDKVVAQAIAELKELKDKLLSQF